MPDFEEIYRTYFADVYRYALALSRDAHTAEEVTQETFFRALASIDQFRGDCQLRVWLCQIARNQYLSLCRERKRRGELEKDPGDDGIERGFADRDAARRLHRLLHDLPEPYKEVFSLRTFRSPIRRCSPCGPSGSCPSPRSGSCSARRSPGPG